MAPALPSAPLCVMYELLAIDASPLVEIAPPLPPALLSEISEFITVTSPTAFTAPPSIPAELCCSKVGFGSKLGFLT